MYLIGILAAFISPASHSLSNIFDAYITGNLFKKISTTIFYANITNAFGFLALLLIGPIHFLPANIVPYAVLIGLINVGYLFPYYSALRCAEYLYCCRNVFFGQDFHLVLGISDC